jgi:hypothetical protein
MDARRVKVGTGLQGVAHGEWLAIFQRSLEPTRIGFGTRSWRSRILERGDIA